MKKFIGTASRERLGTDCYSRDLELSRDDAAACRKTSALEEHDQKQESSMRHSTCRLTLVSMAAVAALAGCSGNQDDKTAAPETATATTGDASAAAPEAPVQVDPAVDAKVAGTNYNATTQVPCGGYRNHRPGTCTAGVIRNTDRTASVTVTYPGGNDSRTIFFDAAGKVIGADTSQADGSAKFDVKTTRKGEDVTVISIGPEHYEIVDALVTGG